MSVWVLFKHCIVANLEWCRDIRHVCHRSLPQEWHTIFTIVIMFYEKKGHTFNPWWFWWRRHHRICCLNGQQLELSARVNMKTGIIVQFTPYGYDDYDSLDWWWWWLNRRTFIVVLKRINSSMIIYCNLPELVRLYRLVHGLSDLELTLYFIL